MNHNRLILLMSVSLDGFAAGPEGHIDWLGTGADHGGQRHRRTLEALSQTNTILVGGGVADEMSRGWRDSTSPMADRINNLPKLVFSQTVEAVEWQNTRIVREPVAEEVARLKQRPDQGDLVAFGGARFGRGLIAEGLVDEYRLTVHPVILGAGLPLMAGIEEPQRLDLVSTETYTDGSMVHVLRPH